ncbi:MAG: PilZ domain-containing protein [Thermodesulfobacteriota bacterium]|nr:PilZ domain-containing protein [Thermodesulfobacteriota bacterium]
MGNTERRQFIRRDSLNLLDYVVLDKEGSTEDHVMGRTLNVSENGILLETHISLPQSQLLLITIGLEDDLIDLKGEVVHTKEADDDLYQSGIVFVEIDAEGQRILNRYLEAFQEVFGEKA